MKRLAVLLVTIISLLCFDSSVYAQILDEDDEISVNSLTLKPHETDNDEELFNELFSDFPETERDITKVKTFDDAISHVAEKMKENNALSTSSEIQPELPPLTGNMLIGIKKGSFTIFRDMSGRMKCSFVVNLKSNLNRELRLMGLNLIFPQRTFAYVFRKVAPGSIQERKITTTGDICYNMAGVPDINIHSCKIRGSEGTECAQRITWTTDIE